MGCRNPLFTLEAVIITICQRYNSALIEGGFSFRDRATRNKIQVEEKPCGPRRAKNSLQY